MEEEIRSSSRKRKANTLLSGYAVVDEGALLRRSGGDKSSLETHDSALSTRTMNLKPVNQIDPLTGDVVKTWPSRAAACQALGIGTGIGDCLSGRIKTSGGYMWRNASLADFEDDSSSPPALPDAPVPMVHADSGVIANKRERALAKVAAFIEAYPRCRALSADDARPAAPSAAPSSIPAGRTIERSIPVTLKAPSQDTSLC